MHPAAEEARPAKKRSWDWTAARRALAEAALPARAFSPRTVLGIDLGSSSVKAVRLARGRAGYRLLGWAMRENSRARREGDTDPLADILGDVIREAGGPADHVAVTLSGAGVQVHSLVLPDLPEREVRPAVEWQVQKEGGEDPAGICIDFVHAGPSEHGGATPTRVLAFSTPRALVEETLEAFRGVRVHRVTVAPCAHAGLMSACGNDGDYAFLDIGGGGSWISLFHGGRLAFTRRVGVGGRLFTQSLTQPVQTPEGPLKHSLADAEKAKRERRITLEAVAADGVTPDYVSVLLRPAVERLLAEVERTLAHAAAATGGAAVERLYLSGGGSLLQGLAEVLECRLGLPVQALRPESFGGLDGSAARALTEHLPHLQGALGTALAWNDGLNLIPEDRRTTVGEARVQTALFWAAAAVLLTIPTATAVSESYTGAWTSRLAAVRAGIESLSLQRVLEAEVARAEDEVDSLRTLVSFLPRGQSVAPQVLKELATRVPRGVVLNSLSLGLAPADAASRAHGSPQVLLRGEVHGGPGELEPILMEFLLGLRESSFCQDPAVLDKQQVFRGTDAAIVFEIGCFLK